MKKWNEIIIESSMKDLFEDFQSDFTFARDFNKNVSFKDDADRIAKNKKNKRINDFIERIMKAARSKHSYEEIVDMLRPNKYVSNIDEFMKALRLDESKI